MNQSNLLKLGKELLKQSYIEEAEEKARRLLEYVLKQSRQELIINSLEQVKNDKEQEYKEKLQQIIQGRPLQYITNIQEFMGLDFYVDKNVLIPQPDTEILVEQSLEIIKKIRQDKIKSDQTEKLHCNNAEVKEVCNKPIQVIDLCTGSGAIAVSIAKYTIENKELKIREGIKQNDGIYLQDKEKQDVSIIASDISSNALKVANKNAVNNKVEKYIKFLQSDMFSNLENKMFDIIVSNPPYIETSVIPTLSKEVRQEPIIALDGGQDGLEFYKCILENSYNYLNKNGYVLLEIGYNQGEKLLTLYENLKKEDKCNLEIVTREPIKDLSGNNRVMIFKKGEHGGVE